MEVHKIKGASLSIGSAKVGCPEKIAKVKRLKHKPVYVLSVNTTEVVVRSFFSSPLGVCFVQQPEAPPLGAPWDLRQPRDSEGMFF